MEIGKRQYKAWLYLAPTIILMLIFTLYPLINTFIIAFKENYNYLNIGDGRGPLDEQFLYEFSSWGFGNFKAVLSTGSFVKYLVNTLAIVFISVPLSVILSLIIAVSLNGIKFFQKVYQTIFFMPYVTNTIAIGMVFSVMFSTNSGLVNYLIQVFGGEPINWLGGNLVSGAKPTYWSQMSLLLIYITWSALPFKILILLSGLQGIDKQYYQAAQIDGASKMRTLLKITVPLLSPQIAYLLITSFIGAFKEYSSVIAIFGNSAGAIGDSKRMGTVVFYIYERMKSTDLTKGMGYAAAGAVILFIIIMLFTALNFWVGKKRVHY